MEKLLFVSLSFCGTIKNGLGNELYTVKGVGHDCVPFLGAMKSSLYQGLYQGLYQTFDLGITLSSVHVFQHASATVGQTAAGSTSNCTRRPAAAGSAWTARATATGRTARNASPTTTSRPRQGRNSITFSFQNANKRDECFLAPFQKWRTIFSKVKGNTP